MLYVIINWKTTWEKLRSNIRYSQNLPFNYTQNLSLNYIQTSLLMKPSISIWFMHIHRYQCAFVEVHLMREKVHSISQHGSLWKNWKPLEPYNYATTNPRTFKSIKQPSPNYIRNMSFNYMPNYLSAILKAPLLTI